MTHMTDLTALLPAVQAINPLTIQSQLTICVMFDQHVPAAIPTCTGLQPS